jgi:pyruvate formate lyase activating enzyme
MLTEKDLISYLERNGKFLQGLVISGGEPTIYPDLPKVLRIIKEAFPNLKLKLFTNGLNPDIVYQCLNYLDSVSVDVKGANPEEYDRVLGLESLPNGKRGLAMLNVVKTIRLLVSSDAIEPVFRCVYLPYIHSDESLGAIRDLIYPYPLEVASLIG